MYELPMMKCQRKSSQKSMRTQRLSLKKIKTVTPDEYIETIWGIGYRLHE